MLFKLIETKRNRSIDTTLDIIQLNKIPVQGNRQPNACIARVESNYFNKENFLA